MARTQAEIAPAALDDETLHPRRKARRGSRTAPVGGGNLCLRTGRKRTAERLGKASKTKYKSAEEAPEHREKTEVATTSRKINRTATERLVQRIEGELAKRGINGRAHSRFPGHALTPTGVMAIRCKQFHLPDL